MSQNIFEAGHTDWEGARAAIRDTGWVQVDLAPEKRIPCWATKL